MQRDKEILAQRDLLDRMLASRTSEHERAETLKLMDNIYFSENLPDNVIPFPLHKVRRSNVKKPPQQSGKKNI